MATVAKFVDKYGRRYSPDEWEAGVNEYVNDPDFENKFNKQKDKSKKGYEDAGAPAEWAARQKLGLDLVSAQEFKDAITDPNAKIRYESSKSKAMTKLQKMAYIPVEQGNAIEDILNTMNITDSKKRMDVSYSVGQKFKSAINKKLLGQLDESNAELYGAVFLMQSYGVGDFGDSMDKITADGQTVANILISHRDVAVNGILG